jgi:hypothetical protein
MYRKQISGLTEKLNSPRIRYNSLATHGCEPVKPHLKHADTSCSNWQMVAAVTHNSQLTIRNK